MVGITLRYINHEKGNKANLRVEVRVGNDPSIRINEHFIGKQFHMKRNNLMLLKKVARFVHV